MGLVDKRMQEQYVLMKTRAIRLQKARRIGAATAAILYLTGVGANAATSTHKKSVGGVPVKAPRAVALSDVNFGPAGDGVELGAVEGDPTNGPHASWVRIAPGKSLPNHSYSNAIRGVVLSGEIGGTVRIDGKDVAGPPAKAGTMFVFPAQLVHSTSCDSKEPCVFQISQDGPFVVTFEKAK